MLDNRRTIEVSMGGWELDFSGHGTHRLKVGRYPNALRYPFNEGHPGLSVYGDARGCNNSFGEFDVTALRWGPANRLEDFSVSFVQHCEEQSAPPLNGTFEYRHG